MTLFLGTDYLGCTDYASWVGITMFAASGAKCRYAGVRCATSALFGPLAGNPYNSNSSTNLLSGEVDCWGCIGVQSPAVNSQSISHLLCRVAEKAPIWFVDL